MKSSSKKIIEKTAFVTVTLAVGLAYDANKVPAAKQMELDALQNFMAHPLISGGPTLLGELLKESKVKFEPPSPGIDREQIIRKMAEEKNDFVRDGQCEIDDTAVINEGGDNGAYVAAWVWCSFRDTPLDKETPEGNALAPQDCKLT